MRIAITGTIGSGKTFCSNLLRQMGYVMLDCDEINRELLAQDAIQQDIMRLMEIETFDKTVLAQQVFQDVQKKEMIEQYLHPKILDKIMNCHEDFFFVEVPLLFEVHWEDYFDASIVVVCDEDIALKRLAQYRHMNEIEAQQRLQYQMPKEEKMKLADYIIENNGSQSELTEQLLLVLQDVAGKK